MDRDPSRITALTEAQRAKRDARLKKDGEEPERPGVCGGGRGCVCACVFVFVFVCVCLWVGGCEVVPPNPLLLLLLLLLHCYAQILLSKRYFAIMRPSITPHTSRAVPSWRSVV